MRTVGKYAADAQCEVSACPKRPTNRGWCDAHYQRWQKHGDPLGGKRSPSVRRVEDLPDGTRRCTQCNAAKQIEMFHIDKNGVGGRRAQCKECRKAQSRTWWSENRDDQLARMRRAFAENPEVSRTRDSARYRRDREKRIARAKESVHRRRARLAGGTFEPGVNVASLRQRDGDNCAYCQQVMLFDRIPKGVYVPLHATIEHVLPLSAGGQHTFANTCLACWQSNLRKNRRLLASQAGRGRDGWPIAFTASAAPPAKASATTSSINASAPTQHAYIRTLTRAPGAGSLSARWADGCITTTTMKALRTWASHMARATSALAPSRATSGRRKHSATSRARPRFGGRSAQHARGETPTPTAS